MRFAALLLTAWLSAVSALHLKVEDPAIIVSGCTNWIDGEYTWPACKGQKKKALTTCICGDEEALKSILRCIDDLSEKATVKDAKKLAYKALSKSCKSNKNITKDADYLKNLGKEADQIPIAIPTKPKKVEKAFALPYEHYWWAYIAGYNGGQGDSRSFRFDGGGILGYWAGIFVLRSIYYWFCWLLPGLVVKLNTPLNRWSRKHISLPALFGFSHASQPTYMRFFTFNLPTRGITIILVGYVIVNYCLIFIDLPVYHAPNPSYSNMWGWQISKAIATRSGYALVMQLPLIFLLAGRNNFLLFMTGWPLDTFNVFHKWIGRITFTNLIIHAGTYTKVRGAAGRLTEMWHTPYWRWGVAGIFMMAFTVAVGTHWMRRLNYELFVILHIIGAIVFIVSGYWHLKLLRDDLEFFYAIWAVWAFDRFARAVRVILSNPLSRVKVRAVDQNTLSLTITYSGLWKPFAGSFVFIHMIQPAFFWESHPFSLMEGTTPDDQGKLKLYLRVKDGMTRRAMEKAVNNGGEFESYIWLDGPYGVNYQFEKFNNRVFFAGGVGITAVYSCIQDIIKKDLPGTITLHWGIMTESPLEWFADEFEHMLQSGKVNINLYIGNGPVSGTSELSSTKSEDEKKLLTEANAAITRHYHIMDSALIVAEEVQNTTTDLSVFSCGPGGLNDTIRRAVANNLTTTAHYVEYHEESFSW